MYSTIARMCGSIIIWTKGLWGIVSANTISSSVGLLASFGAQFAAGGVCRVKGRGLSSLCSYRGASQDDFSSRELMSLSEIYSGLAAWSHHCGICWPWKPRTTSCSSW